MTEVRFQLNPQASPLVISAGEERTPVVIIDNIAKDIGDVIRYAVNSASFLPVDDLFYPGLRARPPSDYLQEIARVIVPLLARIYSVPGGLKLEVGVIMFKSGTYPTLGV